MQLIMTREDLLRPIQQVIGAVERQQTIPALSHLLLQENEGHLTFTATDLELELVAQHAMQLDGIESVTIPARKLLDICQSFAKEAKVEIRSENLRVEVSSGRSRFSLSAVPVEDFPYLHDIELDVSLVLQQEELKRLIDQTAFAMAQQDVRYYLNGLLLEIDAKAIRAVATDGHRLALAQLDRESEVEGTRQIIVPRKGIQELQRLLSAEGGQVTLSLGRNHVRAELEGLQFTSKLIDGRFPEYQRVLPAQEGNCVRVDRQALRQSLMRVAILCNEKYRGIRLIMDCDSLQVQTHNPSQEEAEDEIGAEYSGEKIEVGFNVQYLLDVLGVIDSEKVDLYVQDGNSSVLIMSADEPQGRYVIMPMRL